MDYFCRHCWNNDKEITPLINDKAETYLKCPHHGLQAIWEVYCKRDFTELIAVMEKELDTLKENFPPEE